MHLRFLVFLTVVVVTANAQDLLNNAHQSTIPPPNARFEIVQSELTVRWTFLLDRFSGVVSQLMFFGDDSIFWGFLEVTPLPTSSKHPHPHFQIFTSGIAAKNTFLIDTDTGFTWALVTLDKTLSNGKKEKVNSFVALSSVKAN